MLESNVTEEVRMSLRCQCLRGIEGCFKPCIKPESIAVYIHDREMMQPTYMNAYALRPLGPRAVA
jgi:hypothetical protein